MSIEAMKQALEVIEAAIESGDWQIDGACDPSMAIHSLYEAIAEAEKKKPVLWAENLTDPQPHAVTDLKYCSVADRDSGKDQTYIPLYTAPPKREWVGLSAAETENITKGRLLC
jgi:hypothetical protein